jgi:diadenosine tetraphosphate (Ap4A) HIT family hydrolase
VIGAGRTKVNHLHFHLLPRELEDELYEKSMRFEEFGELTDGEGEKIKGLLVGNPIHSRGL